MFPYKSSRFTRRFVDEGLVEGESGGIGKFFGAVDERIKRVNMIIVHELIIILYKSKDN